MIPELCEGVETATDGHLRFHAISALHFGLLQFKGAYQTANAGTQAEGDSNKGQGETVASESEGAPVEMDMDMQASGLPVHSPTPFPPISSTSPTHPRLIDMG